MRILLFYLIPLCLLWSTSFAAELVTEQNALIALQNIMEYNDKNVSGKKLTDWRFSGSGILGTGITADGMGELTALNINDRSLEGILTLNHMARLTHVEAAYNNFSAITCTAIPRIQSLNLKSNKIRDLTPISSLTSLTSLNLGHNHDIRDISPLASLRNLVKLDLSLNQIRHTEALSSLTHLKELNLRANKLRDLSGIAFLEELESLDFSFNEISDISILGKFPNLEHLVMGHNPISNLNPLRLLQNLKILECRAIKSNELHVLYALKKLEKLHLPDNGIDDISVLAALTNLTELNLANNKIRDIHPLRHATGLEYLNMTNNPLRDISSLVLMGKLKTLLMNDTEISDVHLYELESLTSLETLHLGSNELRNIAPLASLTRLKRLDLSHNNIQDLSPLAHLILLESLELNNNGIQDLSALKNLKNLSRLVLDNNKIRETETLRQNLEAANRPGQLTTLRLNHNRLPFSQMQKLGTLTQWENDQHDVYFFLRLQYLPVCDYFDIPSEDLEIDEIKTQISLEFDFDPGMELIGTKRVVFNGPGFGRIVLANTALSKSETQKAIRTRSGVIHSLSILPDIDKIPGLNGEEKQRMELVYEKLKTNGFIEIYDEDRDADLDLITRFLIKTKN